MATSSERSGAGRTSGSGDGRKVSGKTGTWVRDRLGDDETRPSSRTARSGGGVSGGSARGAISGGRPTGGATGRSGGPRRIRLTLARLDPFSVMKISFVIAVAIGIATVVCVAVLWNLVNAMGIWSTLDQLGKDLNNGKPMPFMEFFKFKKMLSYSVLVGFLNLVIITALGTLFAFLYNIVAGLLGGLRMTFTDE